MDQSPMAPHQKKPRRVNAFLVFLDESGMLMAPLLRRGWAPCGHTPILRQRTRSHKKVSVIAALCVSPARDKVALYFRLHPGISISAAKVLPFLRLLVRQLGAPIVLIWDRLTAHRAGKVQVFVNKTSHLSTFFLPAYAPELNPVEYLWSYLKMNPMANLAPEDVETLTRQTRRHGRGIQRKGSLLRSFIDHSPLPLRLK